MIDETSEPVPPQILSCAKCGQRFDAHRETLDEGMSQLCLLCLEQRDRSRVIPILILVGGLLTVLVGAMLLREWLATAVEQGS